MRVLITITTLFLLIFILLYLILCLFFFQLKQNLASEKRLSKNITQQHEEEVKRYQAQQKSEYKYLKDRLKRVRYMFFLKYCLKKINFQCIFRI